MPQTQEVRGVATTVFTENGSTKIGYRGTLVVQFDSLYIYLDTGNWRTATTKRRMNQASNQFDLGYRVFQKGFHWFVDFRGEKMPFDRQTLAFER